MLAWLPIISSWNPACFSRDLNHRIGRGVPNGHSLSTLLLFTSCSLSKVLFIHAILFSSVQIKLHPLGFTIDSEVSSCCTFRSWILQTTIWTKKLVFWLPMYCLEVCWISFSVLTFIKNKLDHQSIAANLTPSRLGQMCVLKSKS